LSLLTNKRVSSAGISEPKVICRRWRHPARDEAILWLRRSIEAAPGIGVNRYALAASLALAGRDQDARATAAEYRRQQPAMSIERLRALPYSDHPRYLAWRERLYDGLRKAGQPAR